jgi:hypothetical protein
MASSHVSAVRCRLSIARQSGWKRRVNQDEKGSRGLKIMLQLIVAGKIFFPFFVL